MYLITWINTHLPIPGSATTSGHRKKLLDKNVPVSFVLLLKNWYNRLCCSVKWNNAMGQWFPILCGVRQGGVLSPYLYAIYVDDLI